jgi:hypothetical protein
MKEHLPPCSKWTEVAINSKLADIIAKVSGRAFVGEELCQDPEYLDCAKNYTLLLFGAVFQTFPGSSLACDTTVAGYGKEGCETS